MSEGAQRDAARQMSQKLEGQSVKMGIKKKLLAAVLTAILLVIAGILFFIYWNTSTIVLNQSHQLLRTSTESVVNKVEAWMNQTITALDVQRDTLAYFSMDRARELDYIKHTANAYAAFPAGIYVATTEGELLHASFVPGPEFKTLEKPWYKEGIQSDAFIFGSVYFDEDSRSYVVGASGVLKDRNGTVRGVAAADIYLNAISEIVQKVQLGKTGGMFLADAKTGMIIGHKEASLVGKIMAEQEGAMYRHIAELVKKRAEGSQTFESAEGERVSLELAPVPNSDWVAVAYVPYEEVMSDLNGLLKTIIGIAILGVLLLILFVERIVHTIVKPIKELTAIIEKITDGDFSVRVKARTNDEIGLMAKRLSHFILTMREMIQKTSGISENLSAQSVSSDQMAKALSGVSDAQAAATNEVSVTMQELSRSVSEVAQSATSLSAIVSAAQAQGSGVGEQMRETVTQADRGKRDMEQVVGSMRDISERINRLETSVRQVGEALGQIDSIVEMIRGIASQTSLLSLNASIEAARAGEAGKGFSVVAEQIGKLAATSTDSVTGIADLTKNIGAMVEKTVQEAKGGVDVIRESVAVVDETGQTFETIFAAIHKADGVVAEMVEKVREVNDIAMGVAGITQEQSAAAEEILATTENLNGNAGRMLESSRAVAQEAKRLEETARQMEDQMRGFTL